MRGCKEYFCSSVSGGNLWVEDTGVYLSVLYTDQQILYRPQDKTFYLFIYLFIFI